MGFQPTLPRREWLFCRQNSFIFVQFQSTLPRREWQQNCTIFTHDNYTFLLKFYSIFLEITTVLAQTRFFSRLNITFYRFIWCESPGEFMFTSHSHLKHHKYYQNIPISNFLLIFSIFWQFTDNYIPQGLHGAVPKWTTCSYRNIIILLS